MRNGLYYVDTTYFFAGFVIQKGKVQECAPILRADINRWMRQAVWVCAVESKQGELF